MEIYQKINSVDNNMHDIFPAINFAVLFRFFIILSIYYSPGIVGAGTTEKGLGEKRKKPAIMKLTY